VSVHTKIGIQAFTHVTYMKAQIRGEMLLLQYALGYTQSWYTHQGMACLQAHRVILSYLGQ